MKVGVIGNSRYAQLAALLARVAAEAPKRGFTLYSEDELLTIWPDPKPARLDGGRLDCLVTFGGDGTLLRGARYLDGADTPILGVNLGRVGFLTTATPQNLDWALDTLQRKAFTTEARFTLQSAILAKDGPSRPQALVLNDVVVHKGGVARVIRMRVSVDGDEVGTYSSDGIIVATPTGSTAYSMSAGGPIVVPDMDAIVVTAICPHTLAVRPIVIPSTATVVIEPIPPWTEEVLVSFDGQVGTVMHPGERLEVKQSPRRVKLIRLGPEGFFARMRKKLQWGDLTDRDRKSS
jgi:NAD+ kinase